MYRITKTKTRWKLACFSRTNIKHSAKASHECWIGWSFIEIKMHDNLLHSMVAIFDCNQCNRQTRHFPLPTTEWLDYNLIIKLCSRQMWPTKKIFLTGSSQVGGNTNLLSTAAVYRSTCRSPKLQQRLAQRLGKHQLWSQTKPMSSWIRCGSPNFHLRDGRQLFSTYSWNWPSAKFNLVPHVLCVSSCIKASRAFFGETVCPRHLDLHGI